MKMSFQVTRLGINLTENVPPKIFDGTDSLNDDLDCHESCHVVDVAGKGKRVVAKELIPASTVVTFFSGRIITQEYDEHLAPEFVYCLPGVEGGDPVYIDSYGSNRMCPYINDSCNRSQANL